MEAGHAEVKRLLDAVDRLRGLLGSGEQQEMQLHQIVVVGQQSSGKSTLLEALSGQVLPRVS